MKRILAFLLAIAFLPCTAFAESEAAIQTDGAKQVIDVSTALSKSIGFSKNSPQCVYYGEIKNIDPTNDYKSPFVLGDKFFLDANDFNPLFAVTAKNQGSVAEFKYGDKTALITIGSEASAETAFVNQNGNLYVPMEYALKSLGWYVFSDKTSVIVSPEIDFELVGEMDVCLGYVCDNLKTDLLTKDNFEDGTMGDLTYGQWDVPATMRREPEVTTETAAIGEKSLCVYAPGAGYHGTTYAVNYNQGDMFKISFYYKFSDDFTGGTPLFFPTIFMDGTFTAKGTDFPYKTIEKGKWKRVDYLLKSSKQGNRFGINLTVKTDKNAPEVKGCMYIDEFSVQKVPIDPVVDIPAHALTNKYCDWYKIGETVKIASDNKINAGKYPEIIGYIYNSDGECVYSSKMSTTEFNNKGFYYTPEKQGYYEYEFYVKDTLGNVTLWKEYDQPAGYDYYYRLCFVVVNGDTKPMKDRYERVGGNLVYRTSDTVQSITQGIERANMLGLASLRFHTSFLCVQVGRGQYDWTILDTFVDQCLKYGIKPIINMRSTTEWNSPYDNETETNSVGLKIHSYPPLDNKVWEQLWDKMVSRYKDKVFEWEPWNEPGLPSQSVFWYGNTKDFVELQKIAYNVIKKYQPGDMSCVSLEGPMSKAFFDDCLKNGIYDYFDLYATHGAFRLKGNCNVYNDCYETYGLESKPISNTEKHFILRSRGADTANDANEKQMAIIALESILMEIKYNRRDILLFGTDSSGFPVSRYQYALSHPKEGAQNNHALFNQYLKGSDISSPRIAALAVYDFLDKATPDYAYKSECKFGNQNFVIMNKDNKSQVISWLDIGTADAEPLCDEIKSIITDKTVITNFEQQTITDTFDYVLKPDTVYYFESVDEDIVKNLPDEYGIDSETGKREANCGSVLYYETRRKKELDEDSKIVVDLNTLPHAKATETPIFNRVNLRVAENVIWNDKDFKYVGLNGKTEPDFDAEPRFAISADKYGLYVMVEVNDPTYNPPKEEPQAVRTYNYDSVQFALDVRGEGDKSDILDYQFGLLPEGPAVYKNTMPYTGGDLPDGLTPQGQTLKNARFKCGITKDGPRITYKAFIPNAELHPFARGNYSPVRFSLLINDNNGEDRQGYWEWSSGIGGTRSTAYYGVVEGLEP